MKLEALISVIGLFSSSAALSAITITPAPSTSTDVITIRVETPVPSAASLTAASIVQTGNTFTIVQNASAVCSLPASSLLVSEFQVGPLPAGRYDVIATTVFELTFPPPCQPAPITQKASFTVPSVVPALDLGGLFLLAVTLAATALARYAITGR